MEALALTEAHGTPIADTNQQSIPESIVQQARNLDSLPTQNVDSGTLQMYLANENVESGAYGPIGPPNATERVDIEYEAVIDDKHITANDERSCPRGLLMRPDTPRGRNKRVTFRNENPLESSDHANGKDKVPTIPTRRSESPIEQRETSLIESKWNDSAVTAVTYSAEMSACLSDSSEDISVSKWDHESLSTRSSFYDDVNPQRKNRSLSERSPTPIRRRNATTTEKIETNRRARPLSERSPTPTRRRRQGPSNRKHSTVTQSHKHDSYDCIVSLVEEFKTRSAEGTWPTAPEHRNKLTTQSTNNKNDSPRSARLLQSQKRIGCESSCTQRDQNHLTQLPLQTPLQHPKLLTQAIQIVDDSPISVIGVYPSGFHTGEIQSSKQMPSRNSFTRAGRKVPIVAEKNSTTLVNSSAMSSSHQVQDMRRTRSKSKSTRRTTRTSNEAKSSCLVRNLREESREGSGRGVVHETKKGGFSRIPILRNNEVEISPPKERYNRSYRNRGRSPRTLPGRSTPFPRDRSKSPGSVGRDDQKIVHTEKMQGIHSNDKSSEK
jgi:hypothetical protein